MTVFTGLVHRTGKLQAAIERGNGISMTIGHSPWETPLTIGESVAVQGICLTVTRVGVGQFGCDVLRETLQRTSFLQLGVGSELNLERALRPTDRMGGHIVTGHIDGTGRVVELRREGVDRVVRIEAGKEILQDIVSKASVACDGVSLTVADARDGRFDIHLIPFTWENTTLSKWAVGSLVNIETDILAKYVRNRLARGESGEIPDIEMLKRAGFS